MPLAAYRPPQLWLRPLVSSPETGWTSAGAVIDPQTGLRRTQDSAVLPWSSPGDEAMHLGIAILSLVETGSPPMFSLDTVLRLLTRQASAYNAFLDRNPQFGGFLPWVCSRGLAPSKDSCATILDDAMDPSPVPSLQDSVVVVMMVVLSPAATCCLRIWELADIWKHSSQASNLKHHVSLH